MSIALSLLQMAETEAAKRSCQRIISIKIEYGAMSGIMPEALRFCFEALTAEGPHKGAKLEMTEIPVSLRCPACGAVFSGEGLAAILQSCPGCGALSGLNVERGKELVLTRIEAAPDTEQS